MPPPPPTHTHTHHTIKHTRARAYPRTVSLHDALLVGVVWCGVVCVWCVCSATTSPIARRSKRAIGGGRPALTKQGSSRRKLLLAPPEDPSLTWPHRSARLEREGSFKSSKAGRRPNRPVPLPSRGRHGGASARSVSLRDLDTHHTDGVGTAVRSPGSAVGVGVAVGVGSSSPGSGSGSGSVRSLGSGSPFHSRRSGRAVVPRSASARSFSTARSPTRAGGRGVGMGGGSGGGGGGGGGSSGGAGGGGARGANRRRRLGSSDRSVEYAVVEVERMKTAVESAQEEAARAKAQLARQQADKRARERESQAAWQQQSHVRACWMCQALVCLCFFVDVFVYCFGGVRIIHAVVACCFVCSCPVVCWCGCVLLLLRAVQAAYLPHMPAHMHS